jgi:deoxyribonuclease IV
MKIGFHLPISGGFEHTHREAKRLGCEVVQVFVKNPRSWAKKTWTDRDRHAFRSLFSDLPVYAHLSYLPNVARADEDPKNIAGFLHEAELCTELGIRYLIVHCGFRDDRRKGLDVTARSVADILSTNPLTVLLENSAGQGNSIGSTIEDLMAICKRVEARDRLGFCLDAAHLFEAGYDVRKTSVWDEITGKMGERCGPGAIKFFHLNDSKTPMGSKVDRHWHIGKGEIGLDCFRFLVNEKKLARLGGVMETPKTGNMDEVNMNVMRSLLSPLVPGSSS